MKISLRKASKIRTLLTASIEETRKQLTFMGDDRYSSTSFTVKVNPSTVNPISKIIEKEIEVGRLSNKIHDLAIAGSWIKSQIAIANVQSGISTLLCSISGMELQLTVHKQLREAAVRIADEDIVSRINSYVAQMSISGRNDSGEFDVAILSKEFHEQIEESVLLFKRQIADAYDTIEGLNATTFIEVEQPIVDILKAHKIIA